ncbi:hemerythrin domain-containing protein [Pseudoduganella sp. UC29_71]|uniref:hemerythrin domain-containing protein n=1 Tax=Pseudoduganella sp. UC29_71 TaxID=3350174 RepID=UPI00367309FA
MVALSVEQANIRVSLLSFQKYVQSTLLNQNSLTLAQLEFACESLNRLYQACHWRKIEMYLIPAIREATEQANQLLDELNRLNDTALGVIRSLQQQVADSKDESEQRVHDICAGIDAFCESLLKRLDKEEKELFAVARTAIGGEAWFAIANQFLLHDANVAEARRCKGGKLHLVPPPPAKPRSGRDELPLPNLAVLPVVLPDEELDTNIPVSELAHPRRHRPPSRAMAD